MFITITIEVESKRFDVRIDQEQKVQEAVQALQAAGKCRGLGSDFYKSMANRKAISAYQTFQEQGIFSGDLLISI